ncbi:MAG TPA: phosphotransferase family protein [Porticoccaceae bacterium]|nr:phosphotransferase family protein [Porticoccaceae bacterium]HCO60778.1 phosphotransferase family protein [Porticoccaceae bacterium]
MAYTQTLKNRAQPSPAWIESVRANYPVESTLDDVLTTKLRNRTRTGAHKTDFEALEQRLIAYIKSVTGQSDARVSNLNRLTGGASKEQFTFDLTWNKNAGEDPSGERETRKLILRMDPAESVVETHRLREAQVLRAMWGEVPVPEVFWVEPSAEKLGHPFLIAGFLDGTVQPDDGGKVTGLGMYFEPRLREALKDQFIQHLAAIHTVDWRQKDLSAYDTPEAGTTQANEWSLGLWERIWQEDTLEAHPVMEQAAIWLKENMPVVDNPVIVHGDYRSGNFMYSDDENINAILDWELCHIGDFHEDIAYNRCKMLGTPDGKGGVLCSGLAYYEEFVEKYEAYSGYRIDEKLLTWYDIFTHYKIGSISCTSLRVAHQRKTHLDAMMNLIGGLGYMGTSELQKLLDAL